MLWFPRFEEAEMLAYKICEIFESENRVNTEVMRKKAFERHNAKDNVNCLLNIYNNL